MASEFDNLFNSNVWKILHESKYAYKIAYLYLSRKLNTKDICFIDEDILHDPNNFLSEITDEMKRINNGNDTRVHINNKHIIKKIGSSVVGNNTTQIVYSSNFIPFDSSF